jgi:hypothetical protein
MLRYSTLALAALILFSTSCASIVSKSSYPLTINTAPNDARVRIVDDSGMAVYLGNSPATVDLKAGSKYFKKASYSVYISKEGYDELIIPVNFKLDGWYFGNLIFGGLIGLLIVDPATGAMYKIETENISANLTQSVGSTQQQGLEVYAIDDIPAAWRDHLVELGKE